MKITHSLPVVNGNKYIILWRQDALSIQPVLFVWILAHPGTLDPALTAILANDTRWQYYGTPNTLLGALQMTWNSSLISAERVNIELWGYREVSSTPGTGSGNTNHLIAEWTYLYSLGKNLPNSGVFSFLPKPTTKPLSDWEVGSIHVRSASHADGARYNLTPNPGISRPTLS